MGAPSVSHKMHVDPKELVAKLSLKQKLCLRLVLEHKTSKEMAINLHVSSHAIDMRIRTAMTTLGVSSRMDAAIMLQQVEQVGVDSRNVYGPPDMASVAYVSDHHQHGLTSLSEGAPGGKRFDDVTCIDRAQNPPTGVNCQTLDKPDVWDVLCASLTIETHDRKPRFLLRRVLLVLFIVVISLFSFSSFIFAMKLVATWS